MVARPSLKVLVFRLLRTFPAGGFAPLLLFVLASPPEAPSAYPVDGIAPVHGLDSGWRGGPAATSMAPEGLDAPSRGTTRDPSPRSSGDRSRRAGSLASGPLTRPLGRPPEVPPRSRPTLPVGFLPDKALAPPTTA
jgi:hypothetical protein